MGSDEQQQAMTAERLAEMMSRATVLRQQMDDESVFVSNHAMAQALDYVLLLGADNERLRAREAALVEIARAVSGASITVFLDGLPLQYDMVDVAWAHLQDQARALLAAGEQAQGEA